MKSSLSENAKPTIRSRNRPDSTPRFLEHAKVKFTLHDIRRTAASEVDRIDRGIGPVFLQHKQFDVSSVYYLNADEELREAMFKMRVPIAFKHGHIQAVGLDTYVELLEAAGGKRRHSVL